MNKKPGVTRKPQKEHELENYINKGLSSKTDSSSASEDDNSIVRVQLRLSKSKLDQIDSLLSNRSVKVSRHVWLLEAIEEKLNK